jgi:hypothetical protein
MGSMVGKKAERASDGRGGILQCATSQTAGAEPTSLRSPFQGKTQLPWRAKPGYH